MISIYHDSPTSEVTVEPDHAERVVSVTLGQWPRSVLMFLSADVAERLNDLLGAALTDLSVQAAGARDGEEVPNDA